MQVPSGVKITAVNISHIDLIRSLWEQLNDFNRSLHRAFFREDLHQTWTDYLCEFRRRREQGRIKLDIAQADDTLVGYCLTSIDKMLQGEIVSLFVHRQFRCHGIGSRILKEHLAWLTANRAGSVFFSVHPCNTDAIRFCWRFGFFSNSPLMELCRRRSNFVPSVRRPEAFRE